MDRDAAIVGAGSHGLSAYADVAKIKSLELRIFGLVFSRAERH